MAGLQICQDCNENPAVYGDGLTWSRCSSCQLKIDSTVASGKQSTPIGNREGFEHKIIPGLVSIILPVYMSNYTLFHYTGNCIGSIREHTDPESYELIVVDNGSPVQPPDLQAYYAHKVIKNEENFGVTKAWNQGIRASFGEYIVLINNDVQVFDRWLETMKTSLEKDGYDLVMAHPMYSLTEPFARAVESKNIMARVAASGNLYSDFKDFSCVMFKRSLINDIGTFDEAFFAYCSDSDFFKRMDEAGKKWACCDHVPTSHISDATGYSIPETPEIMNKDKAIFEEKWSKKEFIVKQINENFTKMADMLVEKTNIAMPGVTQSVIGKNLVRFEDDGDAIYLWESLNNQYHHIADPDTLHALGFEFGQENIMSKILKPSLLGEEINMQNYKDYA